MGSKYGQTTSIIHRHHRQQPYATNNNDNDNDHNNDDDDDDDENVLKQDPEGKLVYPRKGNLQQGPHGVHLVELKAQLQRQCDDGRRRRRLPVRFHPPFVSRRIRRPFRRWWWFNISVGWLGGWLVDWGKDRDAHAVEGLCESTNKQQEEEAVHPQ